MKAQFEVRFTTGEIRAKKGDKPGLQGHFAKFNSDSVDLGGFVERIMPGAFSRALSEEQDVRGLINHDPNKVLGRTKSGTMRLSEDREGLSFDVDLPDTQDARDLMTLVNRGDIDQCSFKFAARKQKWGEEPDPTDPTGKAMRTFRELHDVDLYDGSVVTFPAYPDTSVNARTNLWPAGIPEEVRSHVRGGDVKQTKIIAGIELDATCFASVGDARDASTWKLPVKFPGDVKKTQAHIRTSLRRFPETKEIAAGDKRAVLDKIVAAAKAEALTLDPEALKLARRAAGMTAAEACECDCGNCRSGNCSMCTSDDRDALHDSAQEDDDEDDDTDRARAKRQLQLIGADL